MRQVVLLGAALMGALVLSPVAAAAGGMAGTYATTVKSPAELKGAWTLRFAKTGSFSVALNGQHLARGTYMATATTITLRENHSNCRGAGTYAWRKTGNVLVFTRKREAPACQARAAVLAHRFRQVR